MFLTILTYIINILLKLVISFFIFQFSVIFFIIYKFYILFINLYYENEILPVFAYETPEESLDYAIFLE